MEREFENFFHNLKPRNATLQATLQARQSLKEIGAESWQLAVRAPGAKTKPCAFPLPFPFYRNSIYIYTYSVLFSFQIFLYHFFSIIMFLSFSFFLSFPPPSLSIRLPPLAWRDTKQRPSSNPPWKENLGFQHLFLKEHSLKRNEGLLGCRTQQHPRHHCTCHGILSHRNVQSPGRPSLGSPKHSIKTLFKRTRTYVYRFHVKISTCFTNVINHTIYTYMTYLRSISTHLCAQIHRPSHAQLDMFDFFGFQKPYCDSLLRAIDDHIFGQGSWWYLMFQTQ